MARTRKASGASRVATTAQNIKTTTNGGVHEAINERRGSGFYGDWLGRL